MNRKLLSERDICTKFITPAVKKAGWDELAQLREEVSFTKGRIIVRGRLVTRGKAKTRRLHPLLQAEHPHRPHRGEGGMGRLALAVGHSKGGRMKSLQLLFSFAVLATTGVGVHAQPAPNWRQEWGPVISGLHMVISPATSSGRLPQEGAEFHVAIQNVGDTDVVVNFGYVLANGKVMLPEAILLTLTDAAGKTRELQFLDRRYPRVAGRVDDFTVALRSGSTYVLRLTLDQYWSPATQESVLRLADGRYRIAAHFEGQGAKAVNPDMQGIALMNFWKGTLQSNSAEFRVSGRAASKGP
jgi:hypothetical protein